MSNVGWKHRSEIKLVLIYAHIPDVTFQSRDCEGSHSMPISPMPCEADILELRFYLYYNTPMKFDSEYYDFLKLAPVWFESQRKQARVLGFSPESHAVVHRIRERIDGMLEDAVDRMPNHLAGRCQTLYELNLKGGTHGLTRC